MSHTVCSFLFAFFRLPPDFEIHPCCVSQLWFLLFHEQPSIVWMNHEAAVHLRKASSKGI